MGSPGKMWKDEVTRKKTPSMKTTEGSGANPDTIGLLYVRLVAIVATNPLINRMIDS